ncbi:MAG TPA: M1 family metallopeptidase [Gemmatimonadaceae bacterium]|nr:M1 family metallopeptidase [Gemmatimonadaceae bacterium]
MRTATLLPHLAIALAPLLARAQTTTTHARPQQSVAPPTHADSLRGSNTPERAWWDANFYDLHVRVSPKDSSIVGFVGITYAVLAPAREMQIDLQVPLAVDSMKQGHRTLNFRRDGNAFFAALLDPQKIGEHKTILVFYHGKPRVAIHPPWDGGFTWVRDSLDAPWVATSNQGLGASVWWPNKDTQADEPDSQRVAITVPDSMVDVSNGRLRSTTNNSDSTTTYEWFVTSPINNYDVAVNAGHYAHYTETYTGEAGELTLDFWPLAYHVDAAKTQWAQVHLMLACFEHWFGPYPWYADGYKLVEAPHLGMEHQSAVAYGNHFHNGYLGKDRSHTGLGLGWDFIIVHESAHEWFGNNITSKDIADSWVHEGFANYAESLYEECKDGKESGARYAIGERVNIKNDAPVVAEYGLNREGSGDMYEKGGNMLHTIRQIINDDEKWRAILRGLNKTFWHQTVTGAQVENYISKQSGINLSKVFAQYLTTTNIPVFEYDIRGSTLTYRWTNVVPGFDMPLRVTLADSGYALLHPTTSQKKAKLAMKDLASFHVDSNYFVRAEQKR